MRGRRVPRSRSLPRASRVCPTAVRRTCRATAGACAPFSAWRGRAVRRPRGFPTWSTWDCRSCAAPGIAAATRPRRGSTRCSRSWRASMTPVCCIAVARPRSRARRAARTGARRQRQRRGPARTARAGRRAAGAARLSGRRRGSARRVFVSRCDHLTTAEDTYGNTELQLSGARPRIGARACRRRGFRRSRGAARALGGRRGACQRDHQRRGLRCGLEECARSFLQPLRRRRRDRDQRLRCDPRRGHAAARAGRGAAALVTTGDARRRFLARRSFIELPARERARAILDADTFRELLGPFERLKSPWLPLQGVVAQADDGVVVACGSIQGQAAVVMAIEGAYLGGSIGEVSGAKIAGSLELALRDAQRGRPVRPVLLLETGGVRLQEANLGLAAIAEIHAAIVALRRHVPVVAVVTGMVGCFGGLSLAAALCSRLIVTRQARLGMNGPEVIEQEAGIAELDASDVPAVWSVMGGAQRHATGFADVLVADDVAQIAAEVRAAFELPAVLRTSEVERYRARLARIDPARPPTPEALRTLWADPEGR